MNRKVALGPHRPNELLGSVAHEPEEDCRALEHETSKASHEDYTVTPGFGPGSGALSWTSVQF